MSKECRERVRHPHVAEEALSTGFKADVESPSPITAPTILIGCSSDVAIARVLFSIGRMSVPANERVEDAAFPVEDNVIIIACASFS